MANDNNFSLTIVTSLVIFVTYYILVISIFTGSVQSAATSNNNNLDANNNLQEVAQQQQQQQQQPLPLGMLHQKNRRFRPLSSVNNYGLAGKYFQLPKSLIQQQSQQPQQQKVPIDFELLIDDDEFLNEQNSIEKRFDDYGHLRFGKRGAGGVNGGNGDQFDDYGHLRFGRSLDF